MGQPFSFGPSGLHVSAETRPRTRKRLRIKKLGLLTLGADIFGFSNHHCSDLYSIVVPTVTAEQGQQVQWQAAKIIKGATHSTTYLYISFSQPSCPVCIYPLFVCQLWSLLMTFFFSMLWEKAAHCTDLPCLPAHRPGFGHHIQPAQCTP